MKIEVIKYLIVTVFFNEDFSIDVREISNFSLFLTLHLNIKFFSGKGFSTSPFKLFNKINCIILICKQLDWKDIYMISINIRIMMIIVIIIIIMIIKW